MFTAKRPNERKEVLGEVLDLSRYEWIAERARREAREQGSESLRLDAQVSQIDREVSQKDEHAQRLSGIEAGLEVLSRQETERQALMESLQDRLREMEDARAALERLEADAERLENEVTTREQREQETRLQLEEAQSRAARRPVLQAESLHAAALVEQLSQPSPAMDEQAERILGHIRTAVQEKRDAAASMVKEILELEASQRELESP